MKQMDEIDFRHWSHQAADWATDDVQAICEVAREEGLYTPTRHLTHIKSGNFIWTNINRRKYRMN